MSRIKSPNVDGKKTSTTLTALHELLLLCHFILTQSLHPKLDVLPNSFNTVNTLISQSIYSPDMLSF